MTTKQTTISCKRRSLLYISFFGLALVTGRMTFVVDCANASTVQHVQWLSPKQLEFYRILSRDIDIELSAWFYNTFRNELGQLIQKWRQEKQDGQHLDIQKDLVKAITDCCGTNNDALNGFVLQNQSESLIDGSLIKAIEIAIEHNQSSFIRSIFFPTGYAKGYFHDAYRYNRNTLFYAVRSDYEDIVADLANDCRLLTQRDKDNQTACMYAIRKKRQECAELLLNKEAKMQTESGETALMRAAQNGDVKSVELLRDEEAGLTGSDGETALMIAAKNGHAECVKLLLDEEATMRDECGLTAIMIAAQNGQTECVKLLLGKEVGMQDSNGQTALMRAAKNGYTECAKLLLGKEARMRDSTGRTALMSAAHNGQAECIKLLLKEEARMRDSNGQTALMFAAASGYDKCVALLLEESRMMMSEMLVLSNDLTALMFAARKGHVEYVKLLLKEETKVQDSNGQTALMRAAENGHAECAGLLLDKEAKILDNGKHSCLYYALIGMPRRSSMVDIENYKKIIDLLQKTVHDNPEQHKKDVTDAINYIKNKTDDYQILRADSKEILQMLEAQYHTNATKLKIASQNMGLNNTVSNKTR